MDIAENGLSSTEARNTIAELDMASNMAEQALDDTRPAPAANTVDEQVLGAVSAANVDILRNKARRQREKGIENLARRHEGVASLITRAELKERVVASAFERYFATIETGIHVIHKSGAMFVGEAAAAKLEQSIVDRIASMEERIDGELARIRVSLAVHESRADWIKPTYTRAAADHEVQLRTRLANRVLQVFRKQDEFVVVLNQLCWNDEAESDAIEMEELNIKKEMRGLAQFISRTLRGMRNKVQPKETTADASQDNDGAPASEKLAA
ncbi:hypothetical protein [Massilia sp. LC238]|uniref:hypothetical protein n=1 Tax=Massilia sp. LC238 TaxID=1502852 RepID=UPI0004E3C34C|nr:hypothetical protein [Massilia sp. LC238]KFC72634.1 hypothetical protein FG94_01811 [Massilia sp. LC238]